MADDFGMGYALGQDSGNSNGNGLFGNDGIWAILLAFLHFIFCSSSNIGMHMQNMKR